MLSQRAHRYHITSIFFHTSMTFMTFLFGKWEANFFSPMTHDSWGIWLCWWTCWILVLSFPCCLPLRITFMSKQWRQGEAWNVAKKSNRGDLGIEIVHLEIAIQQQRMHMVVLDYSSRKVQICWWFRLTTASTPGIVRHPGVVARPKIEGMFDSTI